MHNQPNRTMIKALRLFLAAALLVGLALGLFPAPAHARDVPFPTEHTMDANFDDARDVYAADIDGDGDLDVLSASYNDNKIAWYKQQQQFTAINVGLDDVKFSGVSWGDYDNDGDLDILLSGYTSTLRTKAYRNDNNDSFTAVATLGPSNSPGSDIYGNSVAWGDYDNDDDLDVLYWGGKGNNPYVYKNDAGSFSKWNDTPTNIYMNYSRSAWGDYDNDGRLDFIATGTLIDGSWYTNLWKNDGAGGFTTFYWSSPRVKAADVAWGDYDNDGDLDFIIAGDAENIGVITRIYSNDGDGTFTNIAASLPGVTYPGLAWGDYDNDGDLDILLTGDTGSGYLSEVYRNTGGSFAAISAGLPGVKYGAVAWGDYDNDGDPDILLTGDTGSGYISEVYRNTGGSFTAISAGLPGVAYGGVAWGDYDNDGDLDILLTGDTGSGGISRIYRNNSASANTAPNAPGGLSASVSQNNDVTLSWNKSTDAETPQNALTYNIRIGSTSGGVDIVAPMANLSNGYHRTPILGNTNHNNSWVIKNLSTGTYYWSVQAVDNAFAGSAFATENTFQIAYPPAVTTANVTNITATGADCGGNVTDDGGATVTARGVCWNTTGSPTTADSCTSDGTGTGVFTSSLTGLTGNGQTYYVRAYATNVAGTSYGEQKVFATPMTPPGNALDFDGTDDYVEIADDNSLDLISNYTLEAWIYPNAFASMSGIVSKYQSSGANGYFVHLTDSSPYTGLDFDGTSTSNGILAANKWYHIAAVNDNGTRRLYVNGVEQTLSGTAITVQSNSNPIRIASDFGGRYFNGRIDAVRIWSTARTQTEIRDNMHKTLNGDETNLVACYRFDHISGTALDDLTTNDNDGTLKNMTAADWVASTAPLGSGDIQSQNDVRAIWTGGSVAAGPAGLIITNANFLQDTGDDIVFGHNNLIGSTTSDLPTGGDWDAGNGQRWARVWYFSKNDAGSNGGNVDITFDFSDGGMSGTPGGGASNYRLLERAGTSGAFTDITAVSGAVVSISIPGFGDLVIFSGVNSTELGSYYTLGTVDKDNSPTAVRLVSFTATPVDGAIRIAWETASEVDILGFNLYRSRTAEGEYTRLAYIPAEGSLLGALYTWLDSDVQPEVSYYYKLKELAPSGQGTFHGPVRATLAAWPAHVVYLPLLVR